jgi:hypothetical protein
MAIVVPESQVLQFVQVSKDARMDVDNFVVFNADNLQVWIVNEQISFEDFQII